MKRILLYILILVNVCVYSQTKVITNGGTPPKVITDGGSPPKVIVSAWTLAEVPNKVLWVEADFGVTLSGSEVSQWNDQSGNANHLTQAGATKADYISSDATLNNKPVIAFNGSNDFMNLTSGISVDATNGWTSYVVYKKTSTAVNAVILGLSSGATGYWGFNFTDGKSYILPSGSNASYSSGHVTSYSVERWTITNTFGAATGYLNKTGGSATRSGTNTTWLTYNVFGKGSYVLGTAFMNGRVYAVLIVARVITFGSAEDNQIWDYFKRKTGLTSY